MTNKNAAPKSEAKHTPGPWTAIEGRNGFGDYMDYVYSGQKETRLLAHVALAIGDTPFQRGITQANARLIASAPDLLIALKLCEDELVRKGFDGGEPVNMARAAILKAEGK